VTFGKKKKRRQQEPDSKRASSADLPPLSRHYPDELAVRFVRRRKVAADDREIDLLQPFGAAKMRRDVPNFDGARGEERRLGNEFVPCLCRSAPDAIGELSAKSSNF
jgi:hypothetical protein